MGASGWLRSIWQDRAAFADKPALILWGLKDIAFRRKELGRWKSALRDVDARVRSGGQMLSVTDLGAEALSYGHRFARSANGLLHLPPSARDSGESEQQQSAVGERSAGSGSVV
ncbi:MAG: hypothetical protein F4060_02380 [Holophagales bacterium]|nr:hypothetical protein [Holophagales bacterium]MYI78765.1 hypothetical protein [Holophagales bacterium]